MGFNDKQARNMNNKHRRKKYYFEESSQRKYLFSYFILAGLVMVLFTLLFVYFSMDSLSIIYDNNHLKIGKTPDIMLNSILSIHGILIIVCGISILYFVTRFTHKTVGPLFKIGRTIDNMTHGDLTSRIYLRKNDECKELADKINHFNAVMYKKCKEMEALSNDLDRCLEEQNQSPDQLASIRDINDRIKHSLSFLNLSEKLPEQ